MILGTCAAAMTPQRNKGPHDRGGDEIIIWAGCRLDRKGCGTLSRVVCVELSDIHICQVGYFPGPYLRGANKGLIDEQDNTSVRGAAPPGSASACVLTASMAFPLNHVPLCCQYAVGWRRSVDDETVCNLSSKKKS